MVAGNTLLKFLFGQMLDQLRENGAARVHPSLFHPEDSRKEVNPALFQFKSFLLRPCIIVLIFSGLEWPHEILAGHTTLDLIRRAETENRPLSALAAELASRHAEKLAPALPVQPPEIWACGCTYEASSSFRDAEHGTREGMYAYVYREPRPEIFFKGTARVCVPSGQPIGIRADSRFTAPEPEMAVVLGSQIGTA